jgi:hypothetical protein
MAFMRKRDDGGVTIELPMDLENIDECIEYVNENEISNIMVASDISERFNLNFLNKIICPQNIIRLDVNSDFSGSMCYIVSQK